MNTKPKTVTHEQASQALDDWCEAAPNVSVRFPATLQLYINQQQAGSVTRKADAALVRKFIYSGARQPTGAVLVALERLGKTNA